MEYREFVCAVEKGMNMKLKGGVKASVYTAVKNNGKEKKGIMVECPGVNISPTIYLEEFYDHYQKGKSMEEIIGDIFDFYEQIKCEKSWDTTGFENYDRLRDKVVFKLVHTEQNKELLKSVPHKEFLDLSIVFYVLLHVKKDGSVTMMICNHHLKLWNITVEELYAVACENAKRLIPAQLFAMSRVVDEILNPSLRKVGNWTENLFDKPEVEGGEIMYVLTNSLRNLGASCILYPHVLDMAGEIIGEDFYVLPSSIHEVILVPESNAMEQMEMDEMVTEINATQVAEEEILSNHAYFYERETGLLILQQYENMAAS